MDRRTESLLQHMVRVGTVMSVDNDKMLARVLFRDLGYTSGWLHVIVNQPFIPDYTGPQRTEYAEGGSDAAAYENHKHDLIIKPWMPKVNETVLCIYKPSHNGDGYILGGVPC